MKFYRLFLFLFMFSCVPRTIENNYKLSKYQKESTHFDIYHAKGYFYKGRGFIMVKHTNNSTLIFKCHIDTVYENVK